MCLIILSRKLFSISVVIYVCIAFKFFDNCHTSVWIGLQRQRSNYWMQNIWNKAVSDNRLNVISTFCLAPRQTFTLSRTIKSICHFKSQYSPETFGSKIVIRLAAKLIMWAGTPSHHIENHWNIISLTGAIHVKTSPDNSTLCSAYILEISNWECYCCGLFNFKMREDKKNRHTHKQCDNFVQNKS